MIADIRARFLPRFTKIAAERVERSLALAGGSEWHALIAELHALAGEAALLELGVIAKLAREGEQIARAGQSSAECERVLRELAVEIAAIAV